MNKGMGMAAVVAVFVLAGASHSAADTAADRCGGSKTKAAARYAKALFACHASALARGESVDPACTAKAAGVLAVAFGKAETPGGCATADDETDAQAIVDAVQAEADALLAPGPTAAERVCASGKMKAAGRHVQVRLGCYGKAAMRSTGPGDECLAKADEKLAAAFSRAETRGGCTTTGDTDAVRIPDTDAVEDLVRILSPACGDGILGPLQECERGDDAACPGLCSKVCACVPPPVCGDGVAGLPEECDDGNLDDNDGCSALCELEQTAAVCAGVAPTSGTAIDAVFVSNDFTAPTYLTAPRLDPTRLFVVERAGFVRILRLADDSVEATPFLDLSDLTTVSGERGFFSMAFDPDYENNGRFYVSHTNPSGDLVLARYEVDSGNPDLADESTRHELLVVPHPGAQNHNGGQVQFGNDGYLYWSMGDGGTGTNSQDDGSMLGKLLRLDVNHASAPFVTVPPGNPHYIDGSSELEYIWAKGLRNPWRFSFDRATGDLYIGDVGGGSIEEIDFAPSTSSGAENYGWNLFEGTNCRNPPCADPPTGFTMPVHQYPHGRPCAVMGGYAYRGCAMPDLAGTYFFSDYCAAFVHTFEVMGGVAINVTDRTRDVRSAGAFLTGVVSWGEDARGEIYLINGNNSIYRMEPE